MNEINHTFAVCAYKQSDFLEECINSLRSQSVGSKIIVCTSTPCEYIENIAKKYSLEYFVNEGESGIAEDWNFAVSKCKTRYVTVAHQDDIYCENYAQEILQKAEKYEDSLIIFTDYGELRGGKKVDKNKLLNIKRKLLKPLLKESGQADIKNKRKVLKFGCSICCPSVTFDRKNVSGIIFQSGFKSDLDWQAWENLSRKQGRFSYIPKILMYHRIHEASETTKLLNGNVRIKEDYEMFKKFWPAWIAKIIIKFYASGEKSNNM